MQLILNLLSKFLTPRLVRMIAAVDSERVHNWLWNAIDCCESPEPLWHEQVMGDLIATIGRNNESDYERIVLTVGSESWRWSARDYDDFYEAMANSCHFCKYYEEYC